MIFKISIIKKTLFIAGFLLGFSSIAAQTDSLKLTLNQIYDLAVDRNLQLQLDASYLQKAELNIIDKKNNKMPSVGFSATAGYLSNVGVLGLGNMPDGFYPMPHFANSYALQASLLLYGGNRINSEIDISNFEKNLAEVNIHKNTQNVKLLLAGYYLDLYQLYQQSKVYRKNIELSKELLWKINDRYAAGIALKSDRIRNELLLSRYELSLSQVNDRMAMVNNKILGALDLPENSVVIPEGNVEIPLEVKELLFGTTSENLKSEALQNSPESKEAATKIAISTSKLKLTHSYTAPEISLFLSGALNRPYTFDIPAKDIYANNNSVGIKVNIPIGNMLVSKNKIEMAEKDLDISKKSQHLIEKNLSTEINNNLINCRAVYSQLETLYKQQELANENYRRITDNYIEQLALNTEVMDAANQKLEADLRVSDAKVQIVFAYYQLLKTMGKL